MPDFHAFGKYWNLRIELKSRVTYSIAFVKELKSFAADAVISW